MHLEHNNLKIESVEGELNLFDLFKILWVGKWRIIVFTSLGAIYSVQYALSLPNIYQSESLLTPASQELSSNGSQLGGFTSMLGLPFGSSSGSNLEIALETSVSLDFLKKFNEKRNIDHYLIAVQDYDLASDKLTFDSQMYDHLKDEWVREASFSKKVNPSAQEIHRAFKNNFKFSRDTKTGLIKFSFQHQSPHVAKKILTWVIFDLNEYVKKREQKEAKDSIEYLKVKIQEAEISEIRSALSNLIQQQTKKVMLGEISDEYVLKVIDSPYAPEVKVLPSRATICIVITLLAGLLSSILVILLDVVGWNKSFFSLLKNSKP